MQKRPLFDEDASDSEGSRAMGMIPPYVSVGMAMWLLALGCTMVLQRRR